VFGMEHAIDRSIGGHEDDPSLSVTALIVVLADLPWANEQAHFLHGEPITPSATSGVQR